MCFVFYIFILGMHLFVFLTRIGEKKSSENNFFYLFTITQRL